MAKGCMAKVVRQRYCFRQVLVQMQLSCNTTGDLGNFQRMCKTCTKQVAFMVRALLGLTETPEPDAADALAIGLAHFYMAESPTIPDSEQKRI